jgi:hypothetical protein
MHSVMRAGIALVAAAVGAACAGADMVQRAGLDEISWLVGCWRYTTPGGTIIDEVWTRPSRDTLAGTSRTQRAGTTIASEVMTIAVRGDSVVFIAEPSGQVRTEFHATTATAQLAVFENPMHDFPQRIRYRPAVDSLHARIDGGSERAVDFPMIRTTCMPVPVQNGG